MSRKSSITVSVICLAYNQKKFIEQTLDSFVMQKTKFPFEAIVHDDASTDGTTAIIKKYEKEYPDIIKPVYQKVNQFSSGTSTFINDLLYTAKGTYIALCEGDDYWRDPQKLQKQVDFLESHPDYALCFHPVKVVFENGEEPDAIFPSETSNFTTRKLLENNFIQTNSVMYRRQKYENLPTDIMPRDWYLHLYHASFGKIGFIEDVMAVYRRHSGGVWWNQRKKPEQIWEKHGYGFLRLLHEIMLLYGDNPEYRKIISNHIAGAYEAISAIKPQQVSDDLAIKAISGTPAETWESIKYLIKQAEKQKTQLQETISHLQSEVAQLHETVESERATSKMLSDELQDIKKSKLWKVLLKTRSGLYTVKHPVNNAQHKYASNSKKEN